MLHIFIPASDLYSGTIMLFVLKTKRTRVSRVELFNYFRFLHSEFSILYCAQNRNSEMKTSQFDQR